jgi:hypothetical protein
LVPTFSLRGFGELPVNVPLYVLGTEKQATASDTRRNQVSVSNDSIKGAHADTQALGHLSLCEIF